MAESTSTTGKNDPIAKAKSAEADAKKKVEADLATHEEVQRKTAEQNVKAKDAEEQMQGSDKATKEQREKNIEALKAVQTPQEPVYFDPMNPEELADPANLPATPDDVDERERVRTTSS